MDITSIMIPRALVTAARTFADKPQIVGEVLVAACGLGKTSKLSDVQKYILAECMDELAVRMDRRAKATERKRIQRVKKEVAR